MCDFFGGPSKQEESTAQQNSSLASSLDANYQQRFTQQSGTIQQLQSEINQIQGGNTGPGFGAAELAAKTSEIQNNAAASARNAQQATQNAGAGQTFGNTDSGLQSGIRKQINGQIASGAQTQEASALENLTSQNYAQGRANAMATESGLSALSGIENPLGYAEAGGQAGGQAFSEEKTIQDQKGSAANFIGGLLKTGLGFVSGGLSNLDSTGSSTGGEQAQNFFTGAFGGG